MDKNDQKYLIDISWSLLMKIMILVAGLALIYFLREAVLILLAAIVVAAAVDSLSDKIQSFKVPRFLSVTIVYVLVVGVLVGVVALIVPPATEQLSQISTNLPQIEKRLSEEYTAVRNFSERYHFEGRLDQVISDFGKKQEEINIVSRIINFFGGIFSLVLIFVISFYLSIEESGIKKFLRSVVPEKHEKRVLELVDKMQLMVGKWVKGQLLVAVIMGSAVGLVLWLAGVKYALALGIIAGILEFIPVVGPITAAVLGTVMAFVVSLWHGIGILIFYILLNLFENHVLLPKVMKRAVGLHPVIVIISMLVGHKLAGLAGILLAIPVSTVLVVLFRDLLKKSNLGTSK
jgi:predicted PurR-regulated permease PerM